MWFFFIYLLVILINIIILNSSLSVHSRMITSEWPMPNFIACMREGKKYIFFPMMGETKVIAPQKSNS